MATALPESVTRRSGIRTESVVIVSVIAVLAYYVFLATDRLDTLEQKMRLVLTRHLRNSEGTTDPLRGDATYNNFSTTREPEGDDDDDPLMESNDDTTNVTPPTVERQPAFQIQSPDRDASESTVPSHT